ncbi:phosphatidylglycerol:prolipoprotein diacylglycerol transferase [Alkalispirillum mobile]|uniref:Phosphatidylglycerol--prolipoprotein diacylglyceryl transferase n=2 Tax=Alkalispirillum mobile TaxID=85925 RepID=A0A498CFP2_9GAMM|nr:phosphatidylglycerol:prolipoprotein diacylglycerol transferase [Alkalispirillum mobile]
MRKPHRRALRVSRANGYDARMITYPDIDPVAIQLGPLAVHWYGLMYVFGFAAGWWLGRIRAKRPHSPLTPTQVDDLVFYIAVGIVAGGKLGYHLFYNLGGIAADPLSLLRLWEGGMSFHGGMLGVFIACWLFQRKVGCGFFRMTDFVAPLIPPGLGFGRIGNFINGELWGAPSDLPWAMVYPPLGPDPRHPSQLYQALLEGLVLFAIVWWFSSRPRPAMAVSGVFLVGYGTFRFLVEFVRLPDAHIGYLAFGWVTMGHVLTLPMILGGALLLWLAYGKSKG